MKTELKHDQENLKTELKHYQEELKMRFRTYQSDNNRGLLCVVVGGCTIGVALVLAFPGLIWMCFEDRNRIQVRRQPPPQT